MAKRDTLENRVYLFESLASSFLANAGDALSRDKKARAGVLSALADLAHVSCIVADSGTASADEVRAQVLELAKTGG